MLIKFIRLVFPLIKTWKTQELICSGSKHLNLENIHIQQMSRNYKFALWIYVGLCLLFLACQRIIFFKLFFHFEVQYVAAMISLFSEASCKLCGNLEKAASDGEDAEMESLFSRLTLDVIGKAVFNYDFDSLTHDNGIVEVVIHLFILQYSEKFSLLRFQKISEKFRLLSFS